MEVVFMKMRMGFVSNSSNSSFIVAFESVPETVGQMLDTLFPDGLATVEIYGHSLSTDVISRTVLADLDGQHVLSREEVLEELQRGWFSGYPDWHQFQSRRWAVDTKYREMYGRDAEMRDHPDWNDEWQRTYDEVSADQQTAILAAAERLLEMEWPKFETKHVFRFCYGDEDGCFGSTMEHGGIFRNLPHIVVSNH
jgi:hypothetical protein